jgi:topoisomerase-4 subunit B
MGKNTPDRQIFIIDNLRIEKDLALDDPKKAEEEEIEAA